MTTSRVIEVTRRGRTGAQGNPGSTAFDAVTTAGTSTVYTLANATPIISYDDGYGVTIDAHATNGASPTINVDTLGAVAIKKLSGGSVVAIAVGDMVADHFYMIHYSAVESCFLLYGFNYVALNGAQTIEGVKTFSGSAPIVSHASSTAEILLEALAGATNEKRVRLAALTDGTVSWDLSDDTNTSKANIIKASRTGINVDEIALYIDAAVAALVEAAGTSVSSDQALITKEKGDARYQQIGYSSETISSGQITYSGESLIAVDTEGGAGTDDLTVTTGAAPGSRLTLALANASHIVTVKDGTVGSGLAGFKLAGGVDFVFVNATDTISFVLVGANWHETSRSIND